MEGKIIAYAVCLLAIFGTVYFIFYTTEEDEAMKELSLAQQQLGAIEQAIGTHRASLEMRREAAALLTAARIIEGEHEVRRKEVSKLKQQREEMERSMVQAVERVREESVGMVFEKVQLTSGAVLKNARIQSLDEKIVTMLHSEGVSKVPTENLSGELRDRFRFGLITTP